MELVNVNISDIVPYENNPRRNDKAVDIVARSIKEFGFLVPVVLDNKNVIVAGHTRIKAAIKLGASQVPCIYTEGLTEVQIKAFRIMDNKAQSYAEWDDNLLLEEIKGLKDLGVDLDTTGFNSEELDMLFKIQESGSLETEGRHNVITVEPPDAPPLKERVSIYMEDEEIYFKLKEIIINRNKQEIINKILELR